MNKEKPSFYEVVLRLPGTWRKNVYTYEYQQKLNPGVVVVAPFGASEKVGYILREIAKPDFATKPLVSTIDVQLPASSMQLIDWLNDYYPGSAGVSVQYVLPSFVTKITPKIVASPDPEPVDLDNQAELTSQQSKALEALLATKQKSAVIYGVTGSGKTRLYAEIAKHYLKRNKQILILYPEISLSTQTKNELQKYIQSTTVHTYHSKVTVKKQKEVWQEAIQIKKTGQVFTGARSALFLPFQNLGMILVDESHDNAYKQDSGTRYNGLLVAAALAKIHGAKLILGSATPPTQESQQILSKGGRLLTLDETAKKSVADDRKFTVVDMTKKENKSACYLLSKPLLEKIAESLASHKQTLLFLNRRGTARMTLCEKCSWHAGCPNCDMPLTYHHDSYVLQCHVCGHSQKPYTACPQCKKELTQRTQGIKAIEQELTKLFPQAKIARYDSDNKKKDSFSENFQDIKDGKIDIIIGTQLITKGLDLPLLETVGVLDADSSLLLPDYTSEERAFQQLTQVSGRVGRGHSPGRVVLQTYQAESPLFDLVINQDWPKFYQRELKKREKALFPPFSYAMKVWVSKKNNSSAQRAIEQFSSKLPLENLKLLGPAPSFYGKSGGKYSWQIILLSGSRKKLVSIASNLPHDFMYDLDPISLL